MATCPGRLIEHADGTVAGCTLGDEDCPGRELRHEGDPVRCWVWTLDGCTYCGVQQSVPPLVRGKGYAPFAAKDTDSL